MDTSEQDIIRPNDERGHDSKTSGQAGAGGVGGVEAAPPPHKKVRSIAREQLFSIAAASALVLIVIWVSLQWGYHAEHGGAHEAVHMSPWVYGPLAAVLLLGTVGAFWEGMLTLIAGAFGDKSETSDGPHEFKPLPEPLLELLVYVFTGAVVYALLRLVSLTGGFTESPFAPLMTAPAVVGAFMAFGRITTLQLTVIGIGCVWLSVLFLGHSSPHVAEQAAVASPIEGTSNHPALLVAGRGVFGLIATATLLIAGVLSFVQHARRPQGGERRLGSWIRHRLAKIWRSFKATDA